jgi:hypothetical protein
LSRLLRVEFRRFGARRLVRVTTLLALGGIAFGAFIATPSTSGSPRCPMCRSGPRSRSS